MLCRWYLPFNSYYVIKNWLQYLYFQKSEWFYHLSLYFIYFKLGDPCPPNFDLYILNVNLFIEDFITEEMKRIAPKIVHCKLHKVIDLVFLNVFLKFIRLQMFSCWKEVFLTFNLNRCRNNRQWTFRGIDLR